MIIGAIIGVSGTLVKQISDSWLMEAGSYNQLKTILTFLKNINGQEYWGLGMASSSISYIAVSLLFPKKPVNMDKLLNRGKYSIDGEVNIVDEEVKIGWKIFGMGKEFTKNDKLIYILNYAWTGLWTLVFIIGTVYNLSNPVSDDAWMKFWEYYIYIHLVLSGIVLVWFTLGGFIDLKSMITSLQSEVRDHGDDGWVE